MELLLRLLGLFLCVFQVNTMSLRGRALTRYDPCGLGVVHFDKVTDILWVGVVNLGLYPSLKEAEIELSFEHPMGFFGVSQNSSLTVNNGRRAYILKLKGELPQKYFIYFSINNYSRFDTPVVKNFKLNNMSLCNESIKGSQTVESLNITSAESTSSYQVCGRRSLDHTELTSVRTDSKSGDWPWHAAILVKGQKNRRLANYQCGGNVISSTAILTAGHCMFLNDVRIETDRITIVAGTSNLKNIHQEEGKQLFSAEKVIIHPSYSNTQATSDLAIVTVNKLRYTEYVQPICIWGPVYDKTKLYGQEAVVTGFGMTEEDKLSNTLRSSYTRVQNDSTCIAYSPKLYSSLLNEFTFCAGEGPNSGINPRNGDSGGGLVLSLIQPDHKISWFLRGVLSKCVVPAGQTVCDPRFYVVYTDVGPHYGWIYHNAGLNFKSNIIH